MVDLPPDWLGVVLSELSKRGHVASATFESPNSAAVAGPRGLGNAELRIETTDGAEFALAVETKLGRIGAAAATRWIEMTRTAGQAADGEPWLLAAPAIGRQVAGQLRAARRSFVDGRGNVFLWLAGGRRVIDVQLALPTPRATSGSAASLGRLRVLFALLANPNNLARPVRDIAERAGTGRNTVSTALAAWRDEGLALRTGRSTHAWAPGRVAALVDRFADGWRTQLRSRLRQVRLSGHGPEVDEPALEALLVDADTRFGFGGTAGAQRLAPYYRDAETVVHLDGAWRSEWNRILRVAPQPDRGSILVLSALGAEDFVEGRRHVHPLLLYSELDGSIDPRSREFARELLPAILAEVERER